MRHLSAGRSVAEMNTRLVGAYRESRLHSHVRRQRHGEAEGRSE